MKKEMRRANGTGSVYRLSGRRRRPFTAVVTQSGNDPDGGGSQTRCNLGYYETRDEAMRALLEYNDHPYQLDRKRITFAEMYEAWGAEHFRDGTPSVIRTWNSAYRYFGEIKACEFRTIRTWQLDACIQGADVHSSTKQRMRSLANQLYKYAIRNDLIHTNYAEYCLPVKCDPPVIERRIFSAEEIEMLWDHADEPYVDIILTGIYSGWRPQELILLRREDVHLEEGYIVGGMKTAAGIGRMVPIHKRIRPLIEENIATSAKEGSQYLFCMYTYKNGRRYCVENDYYKYRFRFRKVMESLGMEHTPHDTRHTFVTMGKEAGMNEYALKQIVGHSVGDLTEKVYTHRRLDVLKNEMAKICC